MPRHSVERISADELAYHEAIQEQVMVTNAMRQHWSQHLARRYGLGPQGRIGSDGVITRAQLRTADPPHGRHREEEE